MPAEPNQRLLPSAWTLPGLQPRFAPASEPAALRPGKVGQWQIDFLPDSFGPFKKAGSYSAFSRGQGEAAQKEKRANSPNVSQVRQDFTLSGRVKRNC